jgi:hypothetical protein
VNRSAPLLAASTLLLGVTVAPAQIAIPFDVDDLVRALLHSRGDTSRSARIALRDTESGLGASLELGAGGRDELVAMFSFERAARGLYVHTVRLRDDAGRVVGLRVIDQRPLGSAGRGELVVALLPPHELDWWAAAAGMQVTLDGWDQTFAASLDDKQLRKIQAFRDRRQPPP